MKKMHLILALIASLLANPAWAETVDIKFADADTLAEVIVVLARRWLRPSVRASHGRAAGRWRVPDRAGRATSPRSQSIGFRRARLRSHS